MEHSKEAIRYLTASGAGQIENSEVKQKSSSAKAPLDDFLSQHTLEVVEKASPVAKTYVETARFRIYCATWNVNSQSVKLDFDVKSWLGCELPEAPGEAKTVNLISIFSNFSIQVKNLTF